MGNNDKKDSSSREAILARREFFIASALAGVGVSLAACDKKPDVCLNVVQIPPAPSADPATSSSASATPEPSGTIAPTVCLDMPAPEPSSQPSASSTAASPQPAPRVCLNKTPPKPRPRVCLRSMPVPPPPTPKKRFLDPENEG